MNPTALLALISDLYSQIALLRTENEALRTRLDEADLTEDQDAINTDRGR